MTWLIIRGSGIAAFAFLAISTIWGLLLSGGYAKRLVKAKPLTYAHESLAVASIVATVVHLVALWMDSFIQFGLLELFIPGASLYRPLAVSLGIVAFYGLLVVSGSFYVKKRIGQKAWRAIHYTSFGLFLAAAGHGLMAGADSSIPWVFWMYVVSTAAVVGLTSMRILGGGARKARRRPQPAQA
ncbi:MAG: hypothetical protein KJN71_06075 [Acidimicrobiia bacterium]|nr:hypothetical protein [Acidimicrobiia bacterium]NNC74463.1 hypothetical protein [Acidimicrobiia bacterium]